MTADKRKTGANSTFAISGISSSADSFADTESSVLRINICDKNHAHRKSANRYAQPMTEVLTCNFVQETTEKSKCLDIST